MFLSLICALMEVLILGSQGGMSTKGVHFEIIEAGSSRMRWRMNHKTLKDDFSLSWWVNLFRWCMPTTAHHDNNYLILFAISTSLQKRTMQTPHGRVKTIHLHNFKFFYISVIMMITHCCFCYQPRHACWFCFLLPTDQPQACLSVLFSFTNRPTLPLATKSYGQTIYNSVFRRIYDCSCTAMVTAVHAPQNPQNVDQILYKGWDDWQW